MQTSPNTSDLRWYDRPWAALLFFTRLPLWRLYQPPVDAYRCVVEWWPLMGWLTAAVMAAVLYLGSMLLPYSVAVLLAIVSRILLTGALHEDGLADFFDGFGGGRGDRQRILAIMKDSHIGTYGVLSLILYVALLFFCLNSMNPVYAAFSILAIDPYAKMVAAQVVQMMPYARAEAEAKSGVTYRHYGVASGIWLAIQGLLPMGVYLWLMSGTVRWEVLIFVPWLVMYILYRYIWHRLRGYTGDCCGAMFLLVELSAYLVVAASLSRCFAQ